MVSGGRGGGGDDGRGGKLDLFWSRISNQWSTMRWRKFEQISFGVGKTVNHSFSRGKVINIGIQVGSLNNDQPHYFPHLSKLLSFFPLVFSGWIQSLEASEVYFKITAILSIEHPPDKPKASEIISDSITFYRMTRTFYLFVRLHLRACLKIYIWAVRRGRLFVLHTSNSYSNPYATPIPRLPPRSVCYAFIAR